MDQKNQPAAPDHYPIPYPTSLRDQVCNRYLNSARSVDRILADLLDPQRVTIMVGDHGESFLEDGCQGHGIRISRVQNRTPAVVYWPGCEPKSIDAPTMHADVLPTLASACRLPLN
jgi:membrane-anchored protein YejM (alkaline phosphatase superfamily)